MARLLNYSYAMCYSALVEQSVKKLAKGFKARIDEQSFFDLFAERADAAAAILDGEKEIRKISLAKNLDWDFLRDSSGATAKQIQKEIKRWWDIEEKRLKSEIEKQAERVKKAEGSLEKKTTLKAQNDFRIGTNKIKKAQRDLEELKREPLGGVAGEADSWIWPKYHFPGIYCENGERIIRPFRYLIRPRGQPADFDEKYNGAYNAQQERLQEVFFWRELLGRHHGFFQVYRFKERQDEELMQSQKKLKLVTPPKPRKEYEFNPGHPMLVPFLWDHWTDMSTKKKQPDLWSAAAITCDPPEEVKKKGIRRLLTPLKRELLEEWETTSRDDLDRYQEILADYEWTELEFEEVA